MRKSDQLRAIYSELRHAAGPEIPAGDLIKLAHLIFQTYKSQADETDQFGVPRKSRALSALPVDVAMHDGGWKVWSYEDHRAATVEMLDETEKFGLEEIIDSYLGFTWRYQVPQD